MQSNRFLLLFSLFCSFFFFFCSRRMKTAMNMCTSFLVESDSSHAMERRDVDYYPCSPFSFLRHLNKLFFLILFTSQISMLLTISLKSCVYFCIKLFYNSIITLSNLTLFLSSSLILQNSFFVCKLPHHPTNHLPSLV